MQPIGPLMHEHRLIERMIAIMEHEVTGISSGNQPNARLIDEAVDFFRIYADRCHHGKEEDILFKKLLHKPLTDKEKSLLAELIEDHVKGRKLVAAIYTLNHSMGRDFQAEQVSELGSLINELASFYRNHINKEDKGFFFPIMSYFTKQEMDAMLANFEKVDGRVFHDKYACVVNDWEKA